MRWAIELSTNEKPYFVNVSITLHVHSSTSAHVISIHSHSRRLIILLATRLSSSFVVFPRSAGSLPSNIARRMSTTFLIQYEQRLLKDELLRVIRSGGLFPTIQVQSQTSSGSRSRPPPLSNAPAFKPNIALHNFGTSSGPSHASSIATSVLVPRVIEFTGWRRPGISVPAHLLQNLFEESFEPRPDG